MKIYTLEHRQFIPISLDEAWDFFSDPHNLPLITPKWLNFKITSAAPKRMYPGMIITYLVHPLLGIPQRWVTEITHVSEPNYFVDEQRSGPYKFWHHQHHFEAAEGGIIMRDIVSYALPFGFIGGIANRLFVAAKVRSIFDFRSQVIEGSFIAARMKKSA